MKDEYTDEDLNRCREVLKKYGIYDHKSYQKNTFNIEMYGTQRHVQFLKECADILYGKIDEPPKV